MNKIVPIILKKRWIIDALFAFLLAPTDDMIAVTLVPIFCPIIIGIAVPKLTAPVAHSACRIPTDAEELWITAVRMVPAIIPRTGFWNINSRCVNCSFDASGSTAPLIVSIPNIRMANPTRIFPMSFFFVSLAVMVRIIHSCKHR